MERSRSCRLPCAFRDAGDDAGATVEGRHLWPLPLEHSPSRSCLTHPAGQRPSLARGLAEQLLNGKLERAELRGAAPRSVSAAHGSPGLSGDHVGDYMGNETRALFVCASD